MLAKQKLPYRDSAPPLFLGNYGYMAATRYTIWPCQNHHDTHSHPAQRITSQITAETNKLGNRGLPLPACYSGYKVLSSTVQYSKQATNSHKHPTAYLRAIYISCPKTNLYHQKSPIKPLEQRSILQSNAPNNWHVLPDQFKEELHKNHNANNTHIMLPLKVPATICTCSVPLAVSIRVNIVASKKLYPKTINKNALLIVSEIVIFQELD